MSKKRTHFEGTNASSSMDAANMKKLPKINHVSRLFELPKVLFQIIVSEFLTAYELFVINIATSNHNVHEKYLALIEDMAIAYFPFDDIDEWKWIHQRKLRVHHIEFLPSVNDNSLFESYPIRWSSVKRWDLESGPRISPVAIIEYLLKCTSLEELNFSDSWGPEYISLVQIFSNPSFCAHLRKVNLGADYSIFSNNLVVEEMSKHCHNLVYVNFGLEEINPHTIIRFASRCGKNIEYFDDVKLEVPPTDFLQFLRYCPKLKSMPYFIPSDVVLKEIGRSFPHLLEITVDDTNRGNLRSSDEGVIALFEGCRQLTTLCVKSTIFSDDAMIRAFDCCRNLTTIDLGYLQITIKALDALSNNCQHLENLTFESIGTPRNDLLAWSTQSSFPKLVSLCINGGQICDLSMEQFVKKSPRLSKIFLKECPNITDVGMSYIGAHCRHLRTLSLLDLPCVTHPDYITTIIRNNKNFQQSGFRFVSSFPNFICSDDYILDEDLQAALDEREDN